VTAFGYVTALSAWKMMQIMFR